MAASILRFGRRAPLKCFQSENWILQRNPSVAWFCSHPPEPPKMPKTPAGKKAAAAPPEPEEPLDPSTYKNYQHHSYHPFTFADMDVEMAKYRLPQPTANRH
eukprot:XP_011618470.1 PREDICTED: NADH dehydrogenase [ubiquinone] flavoprotein 3, mitochondrial isoform X2 [Takifugu rubripes]